MLVKTKRTNMRNLTLALLAFLLVSCAIGPDYKQPEVPKPDTFRMAGAEVELTSIANLPWWELLRDEELQKLIRVALQENKDLRQAVATIEEFEARLLVTRMDFAPQVGGTANAPTFGRMTTFTFPGFPNPFAYYIQGNLNWERDIWGRIRRSNEAARADLFAQEGNRRAVILRLV